MGSWTTEQILALAPDPASAKSGRDLATPRKWVTLGADERALWGECQGSGSTPYRTQIDPAEPAFRCSCPSRKFPCKHALALFLLRAAQPGAFSESTPPEWVAEWLASRAQRAEQREKRVQQKEEQAAAPTDPAAQARRAAQREQRVAAGLDELERWLHDLVRRGLAEAQSQPASFWENPAARMVDAQAPGVARMVREMAGIPASGDGWPERLLERAGKLHLLLKAYRRLPELDPGMQAEVRSLIGWTVREEELASEAGIRDAWSVLGQRADQEERLRVQRTWLFGRESRRRALLLDFAHGAQPLPPTPPPGSTFEAELVFYPGGYPLRAVVKTSAGAPASGAGLAGHPSVREGLREYAAALKLNPWLESFPLALAEVVPLRAGDGWRVRDGEGRQLRLAPRFEAGWQLLALSGGRPVGLFGEWNGEQLLPLAAAAAGRLLRLDTPRGAG